MTQSHGSHGDRQAAEEEGEVYIKTRLGFGLFSEQRRVFLYLVNIFISKGVEHEEKKITCMAALLVAIGMVLTACGGGGGGGGTAAKTWYQDADGDTFGDSTVSLEALTQPGGYVIDDTDCDDADNNAFPGNFESCSDAVDNDCDGVIDENACASDTAATLAGNCYYTDGVTPEPDVLISGLLDTGDVYSEYSDTTGSYVIYNIAPGDITVSAWKSGLNFDNSAGLLGVTLVADRVEYLDFYAVSDAVGAITGATVSYRQGGSVAIDVTLHDPVTGAPVSGLSTMSYDAGTLVWSYDLGEIPDGDFEIRAAAGEDGFVMLAGQPVTFADGTLTAGTADISVVKAVGIDVPTPGGGEVLSAQPTFSGTKHPSATSGHAIELLDADGVTVWGGFVEATGEAVVLLGYADWSVDYTDTDPALVSGELYQLRVYGLKNGTTDADIISFSEEQDGFFIVE